MLVTTSLHAESNHARWRDNRSRDKQELTLHDVIWLSEVIDKGWHEGTPHDEPTEPNEEVDQPKFTVGFKDDETIIVHEGNRMMKNLVGFDDNDPQSHDDVGL
jgi:hypothetical protein